MENAGSHYAVRLGDAEETDCGGDQEDCDKQLPLCWGEIEAAGRVCLAAGSKALGGGLAALVCVEVVMAGMGKAGP